jgi:hypothetical protein
VLAENFPVLVRPGFRIGLAAEGTPRAKRVDEAHMAGVAASTAFERGYVPRRRGLGGIANAFSRQRQQAELANPRERHCAPVVLSSGILGGMTVKEQHRAEADVRQSTARHRALRAISRGWVIGFTVGAVMNAALVHGAYFLVPLALAVLAAAFAVRESRTVRRLDAELAGFAAGIARLSAAAGGCAHMNAEPVDLITGERVAWVCPDCPAELPAGWRQ